MRHPQSVRSPLPERGITPGKERPEAPQPASPQCLCNFRAADCCSCQTLDTGWTQVKAGLLSKQKVHSPKKTSVASGTLKSFIT